MSAATTVQSADTFLMVRPTAFGFNEETASSNFLQRPNRELTIPRIEQQARREFDRFVEELRRARVAVIVEDDSPDPPTPDAVFPNNWVSFHPDGSIVTYPMLSPLRRLERREDVLERLVSVHGFEVRRHVDLTSHEQAGRYLEGTGAIVFDYVHGIAYANRSSRMDESVLHELCRVLGFRPIVFTSSAHHGMEVYHTNIMMAVGSTFAVICSESIQEPSERRRVLDALSSTGHELVHITRSQMNGFAANILEVRAKTGEALVAMSRQAYRSFQPGQLETIQKHVSGIVSESLELIEGIEGGSARCMLAAIHLPRGSSTSAFQG